MVLLRSLAAIVATVVVASVLVVALRAEIRKVASATHDRNRLNAVLESRNRVIAGLATDFGRIRDAKPAVAAALPPSSNILEFVGALESMASKDSITQSVHFEGPTVSNLSFGSPPVAIDTVGFSLALSGNIFTFIQYLKDIEKLPYAVKIDSISIAGGADGWSNVSNIAMHGTLYTKDDQ